MASIFVGVRIPTPTVAEVDEVADDEISSRSEVIRRYVDEGLRRDRRKRERMQG